VEIALFPLHTVLFPGGVLPLRVFEARYMDMTRDCIKDDKPFGVCLIREGREVGAPAVPEQVGCLARIAEWDMQQLGVMSLRTIGTERFRLLSTRSGPQGLVIGEVQILAPARDCDVPEELAACSKLLQRVLEAQEQSRVQEPHRYESADWVSCRLAELLPLPLPAKQKLLECDDGLERLGILYRMLEASRPAGT
jgi:Lon protease-like protein